MQRVKTTRILLNISIVLFWFTQDVFLPFQTPYLESMGAAASLIGIVVGASGFTQMILRIPLGIFGDRYSRHKLFILAGLVSAALASVLRLLIRTPGAFLAANLLSGAASAMWISFTVFYASLFGDEETSKAMGHTMAACNTGMLLAFSASSLLSDVWDIRMLFAVSIASGALGTLVGLFIREPKPAPRAPISTSALQVFASKPLIAWSLLGVGLQAIVVSTAFSFTTSYLKQYTEQEFLLGISSAIFMAASIASSFAIGYFKRFSNRALISILFGFMLVYCSLLPLASEVWQICLLQVVAGLGGGGLLTLLMALALQGVHPRRKSTAMGFFQAVYGIGLTLGPVMTGALIERSGYPAGFWALALLALISIAAVQLSGQKRTATVSYQ